MTARVLVVDDVQPNLKLLEARLSAEYFEVFTATNGPDAIAICEMGGCDIVLLDVMMPGMDGFEVCRRLRAASETAHLPIVLVTALDRPADRVRGLEAGADDFLTKPVDEIALIARVRHWLDSNSRSTNCAAAPPTVRRRGWSNPLKPSSRTPESEDASCSSITSEALLSASSMR
jgi:DNA-binding response OmpR family regulator